MLISWAPMLVVFCSVETARFFPRLVTRISDIVFPVAALIFAFCSAVN
jgi:hypothetical protein